MATRLSEAQAPGRAAPAWLVPAVAAAAVAALAVLRLSLMNGLPLWLDETWTAAISTQGSWSAFWREAWLDCNPPLYYMFMAGWTQLAGMSNAALRAPSFLFVALAALVAWLWRTPGLCREARIAWGALIFLWWPGVVLSVDARGYALLLVLSAAQTAAFAGLLHHPSTRRAAIWASLAAAAMMTHYYALYVAAVQGLVYLWVHRLVAVRTWPAALAFAPAFGWLVYHLPRLADYARPDVAWYGKLHPLETGIHLSYLLGASTLQFLLCAAAGIGASMAVRRGGTPPPVNDHPGSRHLWLTVGSGLLALLLAWAIGAVRPTLTDRYLTPIVPLALLGVVMIVRHLHATRSAYAALIAIYAVGSITPDALQQRVTNRNVYGYEPATQFLLPARPDRLLFTWDHPAAKILDQKSLRDIGGFFFERAGYPVQVVPLVVRKDQDANQVMLAQAGGGRTAILWLYNVNRASSARRHPPRLGEQPGWRCRHDRHGPIGIVACAPEQLFGR